MTENQAHFFQQMLSPIVKNNGKWFKLKMFFCINIIDDLDHLIMGYTQKIRSDVAGEELHVTLY